MTEDRKIEAAEYVLGTLDGAERAAFARQLAADPAAQDEAAEWARRFAGLLDPLETLEPSSQLWRDIQARLRPAEADTPPVIDNVVALRRPDSSPPRWRFAAGIVGGMAAVLALFVARTDIIHLPDSDVSRKVAVAQSGQAVNGAPMQTPPSQATPGTGSVSVASAVRGPGGPAIAGRSPEGGISIANAVGADRTAGHISPSLEMDNGGARPTNGATYVAALAQNGAPPAVTVRIDLTSRTLVVRTTGADVPPGKSLELWYIAAGNPPKPIGVVSASPARLPLPSDMSIEAATIGASVEPTDGSPTGTPTGPLIYQGKVVRE